MMTGTNNILSENDFERHIFYDGSALSVRCIKNVDTCPTGISLING
jgi:hypothetical protein